MGAANEWTAGVRLYAGRPDPAWPVDVASARALLAVAESLPAIDSWPAQRSLVGYRGCWLRAPERVRWVAYDGVVVEEGAAMTSGRRDAERVFEKAVLATAPVGLLPAGLAPSGQG